MESKTAGEQKSKSTERRIKKCREVQQGSREGEQISSEHEPEENSRRAKGSSSTEK